MKYISSIIEGETKSKLGLFVKAFLWTLFLLYLIIYGILWIWFLTIVF
jgi:hypothetical protein